MPSHFHIFAIQRAHITIHSLIRSSPGGECTYALSPASRSQEQNENLRPYQLSYTPLITVQHISKSRQTRHLPIQPQNLVFGLYNATTASECIALSRTCIPRIPIRTCGVSNPPFDLTCSCNTLTQTTSKSLSMRTRPGLPRRE